MEDDSYERQLQEYGHSQRERRERSSQSPPGYDDVYYERGSQSGQDFDHYEPHRYPSFRSASPASDRELEANNEEYAQYKARTPSDERYFKFYEEGRSRDRSHSSDSEQRYRLPSDVRRRSRSRSPTMKVKRTKELPISYRSHSPPTPTDDEPYFQSDNSPNDFDSAYRKYESYRKRPSSVDDDKKGSVLLNTGLRKEIEAKSEGRLSRKRSYDQLSPKRADSFQRLERQHSRGSRADSTYEYSAKELLTKVQRLRSELNERIGVKDSPSSGSSSDIDPSTLTEAELAKLHREKTKLLQKLNTLEDPGNNSDESDSRHISSKKARLEHKLMQRADSLTKQEIKEKLKKLDETQNYRKLEALRKKELLRDFKKSKSLGETKKDLFDYSEEDTYNSPHDFPPGYMPKKRRKVDSDSEKRSYRSRCDDDHGYSSEEDKDRQDLLRQSSAHVDLYSPKSRALSSLDARLESDVFASHSKEDSRRVSSGSDNNKEHGEHTSRSHRRKSKKDNHITPLIPLGDDDMPDPETSDPRTPRAKCERPLVLPLPEFAQFIQFSPLPSPCHSPERYSDLPTNRERHREAATGSGSGDQSPCFSPQSSSSKTHSPSQSPSGSGSDSKGNTNSESGSGDAVPPGFPTESEQVDPDENKADSLDSVADQAKTKETKTKNEEDDSFSDNNSDIDLTSDNLSIEERIRQLDEKWNKAQAVASITPKIIPDVDSVVGNPTSISAPLPSYTPSPIISQGASSPAVSSLYSKYKIRKRNDASGSTSEKSEQSEIVQTVLSKSSIFDQDSIRLGQTNDIEGKESSPSVNDSSQKSYIAWNKNDTKENPMVTVPGSLLDRLGQGSNGSFPTLTVNTSFPNVTNNVSLSNPAVSCSSGLYNYENKAERFSPVVNDKNGDSQPHLSNTKNVCDTEDLNSIRDQSKTDNYLNDKLCKNENKIKLEDTSNFSDIATPKLESTNDSSHDVGNDIIKAEVAEIATDNDIKSESHIKEESKVNNGEDLNKSSTVSEKSSDEKVSESDTSLKLENFEEMDTSMSTPADTKQVIKDFSESIKEEAVSDKSDTNARVKEEPLDVSHNSGTECEVSSYIKEVTTDKTSGESNSDVKVKGILKKPSEPDSLDNIETKMETDLGKEIKVEDKTCDKAADKEKHLHKQSSTKSEKDESVKEPSAKKAKLTKDKDKRSESSHRDEKHRKKENDKKSDSSHKSSSSDKKDEKAKEKDKTKHKSEKEKKDSEKKSSSSSKDEKKEPKEEKKKKSEKKDKERKEEKSGVKDKDDKTEKVVKEKKEEKSDKEGEKNSEKKEKTEKKEKHEKKDSHKHSKHGKSPEKKSKSSHKDSDSKESSKDKSKETVVNDSKSKEGTSKDHAPKETSLKETEKEKVEVKDKEKLEVKEKDKDKAEKKSSDSKKEHKTSHKVKKSKDDSGSGKKAKDEYEPKKTKEENTETKKNKDDENKKVKDDHSEHKKKDEVNNRNNKDSPDKSKDVSRKESSEKKSSDKSKERTNGDKCKEEKTKSKEKENKDKDPDQSKSKSKPSATSESSGDKPKVCTEDTKADKTETDKDESKKSETKKEEKKSKDSEISKNSNSSSKLSSKDNDKKSLSKSEKSSKNKSSDSKSKSKTPDSSSKSKKDTPKKKDKDKEKEKDAAAMFNGLTEEDRLIFAQFAEEPYMSMYDKVKRRSTEKKMHCEREQEEQKKLLHEYKRGSKSKKASLSDITESSEHSSDEDRKKSSSVQKTKKKFAFTSDDSDSSTDTNVLQTKSTKNKTQTKKPNRILDIYSSDSEEDFSPKTPVKKPVSSKKKKAEVHRDCDHKFDFDSISDSDNKTSSTQQAKAKTVPKSNKKVSKPKPDSKPPPKNSTKKDNKPVKPKRKDFDLKALFSDDSDESMLSDSDSDSDIMITPKTKKKPFLSNHKSDDSNKKMLPRGSAIYTSSEESETDDEFKPMSPPKTNVLPKKVEKRDSFFKEPFRKGRDSDSFSSDHDDKFFETDRNKKDNRVNHKRFSDSFDSDGFSSDHTSPRYKDTPKKNNKVIHDRSIKLESEIDKKLEMEFRDDLKHMHKHKNKKFNEIITDEQRFESLNKLEVAKVYAESLYEKETKFSNLTNKDNLPPVLTDITREPIFKLAVEQVKSEIPSLKDINLDTTGKTKNKKHKKENKKKKKNKEKSNKDSSKDFHEQSCKKLQELKDSSQRHDTKADNFIPDSDSENTGAVNRNLFEVIKSPGHKSPGYNSSKKSHKKEKKDAESEHAIENHDIDHHTDSEFLSDSERHRPDTKEKTPKAKANMPLSKDVFDFQDDDNGIKPKKESHKKNAKVESHDNKKLHSHEKEITNNAPIEVQGLEIEYTTDEHDYKDEGNVCPVVETTEVVIEQAVEEKSEKEKTKPKKRKGRKASGKDQDNADITQEAVSALVKDERPVEDIQTEIVQFETPVSNEQELVIDEGVTLHVEDETDKAVESIVHDVNDETAKAVESILLDGMPTYAISEPVEPTPQLDQNYLQPEFAPGLPNVPQVGNEVETNTANTPLKGKKGRKGKRTKSGQGDSLLNENSNKMVDGKPFDFLGEDSFASVISGSLDANDDDDDGRLQIDFDPPKPEAKQKKPRKPKQSKANKLNDAAALAAENKLDNLFGNFHRGQEKECEINRDSLSSESSELERSKHEDLLFMDREDQRHDSDMMSPDERSTSDDITSPTDGTKVKSRRGRKPKNKDPATAPIPRTNSPRASRTLSPRSPRSNFDPRSPKSDSFDAKLNGPKSLVIDEGTDNKGNKLGSNVFDFDDNDEAGTNATQASTPKQRKPYRRRKGEEVLQSPNRGIFSPEHKTEDKLVIGSPECNGVFSPEHKASFPVEKKGLFSPAFQPQEQKLEVRTVADDKPPEPLFKAFFEAKSKTEPETTPVLSRKNSRDGESNPPSSLLISNVDKTIDDVSKGLFESTDDEAGNNPGDQMPSQKKKQTKKSKEEDIKSPAVKSPIKSPMVKSPVVNPLNSPPSSLHSTVHHQPLVLPGMGIGQTMPNSQPQIGEPQLAGHVPMMSPPIPVSSARPPVQPPLSMPEVSKLAEPLKTMHSPPGKAVPQSPVRTTVLQSPPKSVPFTTVAQSPIATSTTVAPSTTAAPLPVNPSLSKPENAMEGVLKGAISGFLVPGLSASSAMNIVQSISTTATVSQPPTVVTAVSDLQRRQQQMDKLALEQQMQMEQKQIEQKRAELQRQQEHHIKLKEQELKMMERKEMERKQLEEQKKLQEELKSKEEKKKQLEKLHEQLQRQQQQAAMHGVTIGPGGQQGQPPLLSPGAMQRARASLPSPADKQGPRPHLPAHHQMPPGAPFGMPGQHPGAPGVRPGQLPPPWTPAPGMVPLGQDELFLKHQQLQQQMAQAAQKAQAQSFAELQAQIAKQQAQQAQQAQAQAKQTAQQAGKPGPAQKAPSNSQANKKSPEVQVRYIKLLSFIIH